MKQLTLALFIICSFRVVSQQQYRSQFWFGAGIKREIIKDLTAGIGTNARVASYGDVQTLFQEVSLKSTHLKWLRPSIDYRFITSYAKNGSSSFSNRLNFNLDFRKKFSDLKVGARFRSQIYLGDFIATGTDLDPSFRMKPYVEYTIPKTRFTPSLSYEFFYNPQNGQFGDRFNRTRLGISISIDLPGPNELEITYYNGRRFNTDKPYRENIIALDYTFEWKSKDDDKKKEKKAKPVYRERSIRTL